MDAVQLAFLMKEMRDSQKRWSMHPQQACIETMALEKRVDEAVEQTIEAAALAVRRLSGVQIKPD